MADVANPFDPDQQAAYRHWRAWKLARLAAPEPAPSVVELQDPRALAPAERAALLARIARDGVAVYRSPVLPEDPALPKLLGAQLGLRRLDANWLAEEDGISRIAVSSAQDGAGGFIPYTDRAIGWHTDGYYHPQQRRIRGMVLHCVRPARAGGENALLDPELAYIALRDESPAHVKALMRPDAMTIPARDDAGGVARPAQAGPVFSLDEDGCLHLRYTARTRSIEWRDDPQTGAAVQALRRLLERSPWIRRVRLQAGMGMIGHNVLHDRSAFEDDPARPRLLLRARFRDRVELPAEAAWRNG
ncbi:TauD/TfdA family dioxygenase [Caenimonas terrae]|uniref:TauD/TfdA family dioxygenase n=1 Tax=Caenimonas terrae TaxID=696074 RepID=A0ABW0N618_9BURK